MMRLYLLAILTVVGCASGVDTPTAARSGDDLAGQLEPFDLEEAPLLKSSRVEGIPSVFDANRVMDDAFFTASGAVSAAQVQAFFEDNPYGERTFLADVRVGNRSAAQAIVDASLAEGINPIVMVARMQVEKGLVSKTTSPGGDWVDFAFGCGCPDNQDCNESYRGLDKQVSCSAKTLRRWYDASLIGEGLYNAGVPRRTLDPTWVTPENHATASLYAYTPWVLPREGGNWLVWNVTLKYARHFADQGVVSVPATPSSAAPWIGDPCSDDTGCAFGGGLSGRCVSQRCTLACEGYCPDRTGEPTTFCVDGSLVGSVAGNGRCVPQSDDRNDHCSGDRLTEATRFVGGSSAPVRWAEVCLPIIENAAPAEEEQPETPAETGCGVEGSSRCDGNVQVECRAGQEIRWDCSINQGSCDQGRCVEATSDDAPPSTSECPAGVDALGLCQGETAVRCIFGQEIITDCGAFGQVCGQGLLGAACLPREEPVAQDQAACADLGFEGRCDGSMAVWCDKEDKIRAVDCAYSGKECGWGDDGLGYWCR